MDSIYYGFSVAQFTDKSALVKIDRCIKNKNKYDNTQIKLSVLSRSM